MTVSAYALVGLTALVAVLVGGLVFAVLRLFAAARHAASGRDAQGAETAFMAAAMEEALGKMRQSEQAMAARAAASQRLSDQIIVNLTSGILVVGHDHRVQSLNPAGRRLLGLPDAADWTGRIEDVLLGAAPLAAVIQECLDTGQPVRRRTVQITAEDRRTRHLGVTVSPIADGAGPAQGAICLFGDLTDIAELEEQLRLKESLAQVGELTAGIAHEFRNGLATIHGYARLLDLERLATDMRPYVTGIREETDALGAVVRNFLNFARPTELVLVSVDLRTLVDRIAEDLRPEAVPHGGTIIVRGEWSPVKGDEVLLRQALNNLCRNALEACVEARLAPHVAIEGAIDPATHALRISVIDSGPGVEPNLAAKVFQPFVTTRARGTGLGLAVVQKIIVSHNGRVTLQTEPGGGARFIVSLPLAGEHA